MAIAVLPHLVDTDDGGVIDRGGNVGLATKPLQVGGIAGQVGVQHLQGKNTPGLGVPRPRDDRLSPSGDLIQEPVPADAPLGQPTPAPSPGVKLVERL